MKKILLSIIYLSAFVVSIQAQTLYGTTFLGGSGNRGTINKFIPATKTLTVVKSFESIALNPVYTNLVQAGDGKLYGMTSRGGNSDSGVIFSFDPSSSTYKKVKDFNSPTSGYPNGSLIQASNGKLYGMTSVGGHTQIKSDGGGGIFSFDPSSSAFSLLKALDDSDGITPYGSLLQADNGKFYGMTSGGGKHGYGVIFSFNPGTAAYKKLKDFDGTNGGQPYGNLIQASNGKFYGMTSIGGKFFNGVVFSFDPVSLAYKKLADLSTDNDDNANPFGSLLQAKNGKLYGMTSNGANGAFIFSYDISSSSYKKLLDFGYPAKAFGNLIQLSNGKLYGMITQGDTNPFIFAFDPSSSAIETLHDFDGVNGNSPQGSLTLAGNGKLYGMTSYGGSANGGVIFSFDPSSSTFIKLKNIAANETGSQSLSALLQAGNKKLYGTTQEGGSEGLGTIFSFDPFSSTYKKLKDFKGTDGANRAYSGSGPDGNSSLVQANNGKLYGMTPEGGSNGQNGNTYGVIYSFDPASSTYTKLKDFDNTNGANPLGPLVQASNGKLYGVTFGGGSSGNGVIFSFDPASSTFKKIKDFNGADGAKPCYNSSLLQAKDGKLYGVTASGGTSNVGVIFSFDPVATTYTKLKDFDNTNGASPYGSLVQAGNGKLYGTTYLGGSNGSGVIFSFDASNYTYTKLKDFDFPNAAYPAGGLMQASDGKLYGTTSGGTNNFAGVIFSIDPSNSIYTQLKEFDYTNGAVPYSTFIEVKQGATLEAEQALLQGAIVAADNPGFTGSGYADYQNASGDYIEWTVNASSAGSYLLKFKYANAGTANRALNLKVNGSVVASSLSFSSTGSWTVWSVSSATANLIAGTNKVRLTATGSNGPNVDNLTIDTATCQSGILEAEQAILNGAALSTLHTGYTGSGYTFYQSGAGNYVEWTINASAAGAFSLQFRYANGGSGDLPLQLKVNGAVAASSLPFSSNGNWGSWAVLSKSVNLIAGSNKVRLTTIGTNGPNLDHLAFNCNIAGKEPEQRFASTIRMSPPGILRVSVAPNPVERGTVKLVLSTSSDLPFNLQLIDMPGRTYKSLKFVPLGSRTFDFPVNDLPPGAYTIILTQGALSTQARLIIGSK